MREIEVSRLTDVIEKLCIEANEHLPEDVKCAIKTCRACEDDSWHLPFTKTRCRRHTGVF